MYRTHTCNQLTLKNKNEKIILSGWVHRRRDHGGLIFIDLRDRYGLTQIVFDPTEFSDAHKIAETVRSEYVLKIQGTVRPRLEGAENKNLATGEIEILVNEIQILNKAITPPFEIDQDKKVNEEVRLSYRYLDLRRERLKNNILMRHKIIKMIRDFMDSRDFVEIETPILVKGTPEGSREYLVPSRLYPGNFYVLPQSPQQLKQLLMVGGMDRYFQIARCFRDEDQRGDRQPEFTQFDVEMSFVEQEDVMEWTDELLKKIVTELYPQKKLKFTDFPRLTYEEAMNKYGSDKPDVRFGLEFVDLSEIGEKSGFQVFQKAVKNGGTIKAICVPNGAEFTRKEIDELTRVATNNGAKGLAYITMKEDGPASPILKFLGEAEIKIILEKTEAQTGDIIFFGADSFQVVCESLDKVRLALRDKLQLVDENELAFLWVTDFPMFEVSKETGELSACHHPFTRPNNSDIELLKTDPVKARSVAYDIVCNGSEIGGGSLRIHEKDLQARIFDVLKISKADTEKRFGHMLKAFEYGAPPHGGIAWGLDRLVMILQNEPNIREVIPFPKDQKAKDLMLGAPSEMPTEQVEELGIQVLNKENIDQIEETEIYKKLKALLNTQNVNFEEIRHQAVFTSQEAANVRGTKLKQGARALVCETEKGGLLLAVSSAAYEINLDKLGQAVGEKVGLFNQEMVAKKINCKIGAVPPFGNLFDLATYVDEKLLENDKIAFNAGANQISFKMKLADFLKVTKAQKADFAKDK